MSKWLPRRFFWLFLVPNLIFAAIALPTDAVDLIPVLNAAVLAGSIGVCIAYGPAMVDTLTTRRPLDQGDWLGLGIFCAWFGVVVTRTWSTVWRALGQPTWLANTDIVSYGLYLAIVAAVFHMAAPGAIEGRAVPTRRWLLIGALFSIVTFATLLGLYLFDDLIDGWLVGARAWAQSP